MKYYILQKIGYEYNDEVYRRSEDSSGKPQEVFLSKEKAQEIADRLDYQEIKGVELGSYGYSPDEYLKDADRFCDVYNKLFNENIAADSINYDFSLPENITFNQFKELRPFINVNFYEVVECDGEEPTQKKRTKKTTTQKSKTIRVSRSVEMENTLGNSFKVWKAKLYNNGDVLTEWGRIGNDLQSRRFKRVGEDFFNKKVLEKIGKGYIKV